MCEMERRRRTSSNRRHKSAGARSTKAAFLRHRSATFLVHFSDSSICHTAIYTRSPVLPHGRGKRETCWLSSNRGIFEFSSNCRIYGLWDSCVSACCDLTTAVLRSESFFDWMLFRRNIADVKRRGKIVQMACLLQYG